MADSTSTRRRWFQFGLGTMFLAMTAMAVWLGVELKFIRARQAWLRAHPRWGLDSANFRSTVPTWRKMMGDTDVHWILLPYDASQDEVAEANRLFPEAGSISIVGREDKQTFAGLSGSFEL